MPTLLSIVVPVYQEEAAVPEFLRTIRPVLESVTPDYEIIFALDPSPDRTEEVIVNARQADPRLKLLKFSRRFGQPMCALAGIEYAKGEAVIVMDVDLQDPPEVIPAMVAKWREGFDVVLPQRIERTGEPLLKKWVSLLGYRVMARVADVAIPPNTGDFRLMSRRVAQEIVRLRECHGFLRGMGAVVGFRQAIIPFKRPARSAGKTHYNPLLGSLRIGLNGLFCFSNYALTLATQLGFLITGLSFLLGLTCLAMKLAEIPCPVSNPTLIILVLFLGGVQLIGIGILGEYIGRIYDEVKRRPKFIVERELGFDERN